jgi:hypothetical protein
MERWTGATLRSVRLCCWLALCALGESIKASGRRRIPPVVGVPEVKQGEAPQAAPRNAGRTSKQATDSLFPQCQLWRLILVQAQAKPAALCSPRLLPRSERELTNVAPGI